jgi:hypothetical protein
MKDTSDSYASNDEFYLLYADYVADPAVRKVHDAVLRAAMLHPALRRVVDLGCGRSNEFFHYGNPEFYIGIDQNAIAVDEGRRITLEANYRDREIVKRLIDEHALTAAVSLFSTELTCPSDANHAYYEALFRHTPVQAIFVAGCYAEHAQGEETIIETGGLVSFQTFGGFESAFPTDLFDETRVCVACPSRMFGEDLIEVYRLLQRPGTADGGAASALAALASPIENATGIRLAIHATAPDDRHTRNADA